MQKKYMTKQIKKYNSPVFSLPSLSAGPRKPYSRQLNWTKEERIKKHVKTIQLINRACPIKPLPKFIRITSLRILKKIYLSLVSTLNFPTDSGVNTSQFSYRFRCKYSQQWLHCSLFPLLSIHTSTICRQVFLASIHFWWQKSRPHIIWRSKFSLISMTFQSQQSGALGKQKWRNHCKPGIEL